MEKGNNIEFEHKGHKAVVLYAYGGYCWDRTFFVIVDNLPYIMLELGSWSCYTLKRNLLKQVSFDYLECRKKEDNKHRYLNSIVISDFNQSLFESLFDFMIESNANEVMQDENGKLTVMRKENFKNE